jgi:PhoPQ-activated pathogenicity-related protein
LYDSGCVLLYGLEVWTITENTNSKRIEAAEIILLYISTKTYTLSSEDIRKKSEINNITNIIPDYRYRVNILKEEQNILYQRKF